MAFTSLKDGGLSVTIGGVERADDVHGLRWESTAQGDGGCSFWMEVDDPFNPQGTYSELWHGVPVVVTHTLDSVPTTLYKGYIVSDTRRAPAYDRRYLPVACAGPLDIAKWRTDMGFIYTDADTGRWFTNKRNANWVIADNEGGIYIGVDDGRKIPRKRAGVISYVPYMGHDYLLKQNGGPMYGAKKLTGIFSCNLKDDMRAKLAWSANYKVSRDPSDPDWNTIHLWTQSDGNGGVIKNLPISYSFGPGSGDGAGHVALMVYTNKVGGTTVNNERFASIDDCIVYTGSTQKSVDEAMTDVATIIGLHSSTDVADIGSLLPSLAQHPLMDPITALTNFAAQGDSLVEWGWFRGVWRCRPMETNPVTIRGLSTCYLVDSQLPGIDWGVMPESEYTAPRNIRLQYGKVGGKNVRWPAGTPATKLRPGHPGWASGVPFQGVTSPVMSVRFSDHNLTDAHAERVADALARNLGVATASGPVSLKVPTIPIYGGGTRPVPYLHGGDWIEESHAKVGPVYISRAAVDADTGYVELECGYNQLALIDQLVNAGRLTRVPLYKKPKRKKRK